MFRQQIEHKFNKNFVHLHLPTVNFYLNGQIRNLTYKSEISAYKRIDDCT